MHTVTDLVGAAASAIKAAAEELLLKHSGLEYDRNLSNPGNLVILSPAGDHNWKPLGIEGQRLRSKIRRDFARLHAVVKVLLKMSTAGTEAALNEAADHAYQNIDQEGSTWHKTTPEAVVEFNQALDRFLELMAGLHDGGDETHVYVPDTNALLFHPNLEDWAFAESPRFTLVLTPPILSELDQLKIFHRNENVQHKAEGLIRRIKGYRSRGQLSDGVPLRTGRSSVKTTAVEPDMSASLPWLDPDNNDDRLLAGFLEVMRLHPRCPVVLVTRDINLQNKAESACLPFAEPPEPTPAGK